MKKRIVSLIICLFLLVGEGLTLISCEDKDGEVPAEGEQSQEEKNSSKSSEKGNSSESSNGTVVESETDGFFTYILNEDKKSYTLRVLSGEDIDGPIDWESEEAFREAYAELFSKKEIVIPSEYRGLPITVIGDFSFSQFPAFGFKWYLARLNCISSGLT